MSQTLQKPTELRWLAETCGLDSGEVPLPMVISEQRENFGFVAELKRYLAQWLANVDRGSVFDRSTRLYRWLPVGVLLRVLAFMGYDGLLYWQEGKVIGHIFFQRHGTDLCAFSIGLGREYLRRGHTTIMGLDIIAHASRVEGIERVRIGSGRSRATQRVLQVLRAHCDRLSFGFGEDGWIDFVP
jgi:hypothetical protein